MGSEGRHPNVTLLSTLSPDAIHPSPEFDTPGGVVADLRLLLVPALPAQAEIVFQFSSFWQTAMTAPGQAGRRFEPQTIG
jgi:hypothetical protein